MRSRPPLDNAPGYSVRRQLLDADLESVRGHMIGQVLEIGSGRTGRRGRFRPPVDRIRMWVHLDIERNRLPDVQAEVERLPFGDGAFDTVICLEVLEYVSRPDVALREIRRMVKPNGTLILATPFLHRADTLYDYWRFTAHGLRYLLEASGFDVVALKAQGHALSSAAHILKYAIQVAPPRPWSRWLGWIAQPLLTLLWWLDTPTARWQPELATFSTGYLVVCSARAGAVSSHPSSRDAPHLVQKSC